RMQPMHDDVAELILNRTWRPMLAVTGADGLPPPASAGNVLRPKTQLVLSLRLPPTLDAERAARRVKELLDKDPPYGAQVKFEYGQAATGWNAPATAPWLERAVDDASRRHYGKPAMWMGEGGTIPFMAMLGDKFPEAQVFITGERRFRLAAALPVQLWLGARVRRARRRFARRSGSRSTHVFGRPRAGKSLGCGDLDRSRYDRPQADLQPPAVDCPSTADGAALLSLLCQMQRTTQSLAPPARPQCMRRLV